MSKHLAIAAAVSFLFDLFACQSAYAVKTEHFDDAASAAANGWTAINSGMDLQTAGVINENMAGGAAPGEAQYHVYRGIGLQFVDSNLGMTVDGNAAFSITGVLKNLGGVQPDPENPVDLSGDVGFPPILGFSKNQSDQLGIMFRGDDPGAVGPTGAEVAWGLRFTRDINGAPGGNIIFNAGGDFSRVLVEDTSYQFSLTYDPAAGSFGSVTAEVVGAGAPITYTLSENERVNHLNLAGFTSAGIRKFDNGHNPRSNFDIRFDDLTYTGIAGPPVGLPGDYNSNNVVDAADYVLWRKGGPLSNEVDVPGTVNDQDYIEWKARYGNTTPGVGAGMSTNAVPEPTTIGIAMIVAIPLLFSLRRHVRNGTLS